MLTNETSDRFMNAVMDRISKMYPGGNRTEDLAQQIARIAATVSVVALQEYEKLLD